MIKNIIKSAIARKNFKMIQKYFRREDKVARAMAECWAQRRAERSEYSIERG